MVISKTASNIRKAVVVAALCVVVHVDTTVYADPSATLGKGLAGDAQAKIEEQVAPARAWELIKGGALLVDVRSPEEFQTGHLAGATNLPHTDVGANLQTFGNDKSRAIVLYCRSGRRSGIAKAELEAAGYTNVVNAGGYAALQAVAP